jgi:hypothetical protein
LPSRTWTRSGGCCRPLIPRTLWPSVPPSPVFGYTLRTQNPRSDRPVECHTSPSSCVY